MALTEMPDSILPEHIIKVGKTRHTTDTGKGQAGVYVMPIKLAVAHEGLYVGIYT
jgi:hypothetical protein